MENLTEEKKAELKKLFNYFDQDNIGYITTKEMINKIKSIGDSSIEDSEVQDLIKDLDSDGNGRVELSEFMNLMYQKMKETDTEEELSEAFKGFKRNQNSECINPNEIKHVLLALGEKVTDEEIEEMLKEADIDGDGLINYEEFARLII